MWGRQCLAAPWVFASSSTRSRLVCRALPPSETVLRLISSRFHCRIVHQGQMVSHWATTKVASLYSCTYGVSTLLWWNCTLYNTYTPLPTFIYSHSQQKGSHPIPKSKGPILFPNPSFSFPLPINHSFSVSTTYLARNWRTGINSSSVRPERAIFNPLLRISSCRTLYTTTTLPLLVDCMSRDGIGLGSPTGKPLA